MAPCGLQVQLQLTATMTAARAPRHAPASWALLCPLCQPQVDQPYMSNCRPSPKPAARCQTVLLGMRVLQVAESTTRAARFGHIMHCFRAARVDEIWASGHSGGGGGAGKGCGRGGSGGGGGVGFGGGTGGGVGGGGYAGGGRGGSGGSCWRGGGPSGLLGLRRPGERERPAGSVGCLAGGAGGGPFTGNFTGGCAGEEGGGAGGRGCAEGGGAGGRGGGPFTGSCGGSGDRGGAARRGP